MSRQNPRDSPFLEEGSLADTTPAPTCTGAAPPAPPLTKTNHNRTPSANQQANSSSSSGNSNSYGISNSTPAPGAAAAATAAATAQCFMPRKLAGGRYGDHSVFPPPLELPSRAQNRHHWHCHSNCHSNSNHHQQQQHEHTQRSSSRVLCWYVAIHTKKCLCYVRPGHAESFHKGAPFSGSLRLTGAGGFTGRNSSGKSSLPGNCSKVGSVLRAPRMGRLCALYSPRMFWKQTRHSRLPHSLQTNLPSEHV